MGHSLADPARVERIHPSPWVDILNLSLMKIVNTCPIFTSWTDRVQIVDSNGSNRKVYEMQVQSVSLLLQQDRSKSWSRVCAKLLNLIPSRDTAAGVSILRNDAPISLALTSGRASVRVRRQGTQGRSFSFIRRSTLCSVLFPFLAYPLE